MSSRRWIRFALLLGAPLACNQLLGNDTGFLMAAGGGGVGDDLPAGAPSGGGSGPSGGTAGGSVNAGRAGQPARGGQGDGGDESGAGTENAGGEGGSGGLGAGGVPSSNGGSSNGGSSNGGSPNGGSPSGTGGVGGSGCASPCKLPHATASCVAGACAITACTGSWRDANGSAEDGCETGDAPTDAMSLWLMGDRGVTKTGELVSLWRDQSPAKQDATQMTDSLKPKLIASGALFLVEFDGSDDGLRLPNGFSDFSKGTSFFAVVEALASSRCEGIFSLSNGDDADDIEYERDSQQALYYEVLGSWVQGALGAFEANRRLLLSVIQLSDGSVDERLNRLRTGSKTIALPAIVNRTQNYVGKNTYDECPTSFTGRVGELLFYGRGVSAVERDRIESYLSEKWNIP